MNGFLEDKRLSLLHSMDAMLTAAPKNKFHHSLAALGFLASMALMQVLSSSSDHSTALTQRGLAQPQMLAAHRGIGQHYVTLQVGSPSKNLPKRLVVALDSEATTFPCTDCDASCGYDMQRLFDPSASRIHSCPSECVFRNDARCEDQTNVCVVRMEQPETKEAYVGYEVQDHVGLYVTSSQKHSSAMFPLTFHCQTQVTPSNADGTQVADGTLGMSGGPNSFVRQMHAAGRLSQAQFALCFREVPIIVQAGVSAGSVTMGAIDRTQHKTPLVWAQNAFDPTVDTYLHPSFASTPFSVHIRRIYLGIGAHKEDLLLRISQGMVALMPIDTNVVAVDGFDRQSTTGTQENPYEFLNGTKGSVGIQNRHVETLLHRSAELAFRATFATVTGINYPSSSGAHMTRHQYEHLPSILLQLEAHLQVQSVSTVVPGFIGRHDGKHPFDIVLVIPPRRYLHYDDASGIAVPTLSFHSTTSRLGTHALQGHEIVFDLDHGKIGFAETAECSEGINLITQGAGWSENGEASESASSRASNEGGVGDRDTEEEWVPDDVAANRGTGDSPPGKESRMAPNGKQKNGDPSVVPGEGARPQTATQGDEPVTVTSDAGPNDAQQGADSPPKTAVAVGNGLPGELDEGGQSSQSSSGGGSQPPGKDNSTDISKYEGEPMNSDPPSGNSNESETNTTEPEVAPAGEQGGNEQTSGVEKEEQQAGLPQANQGGAQPAFRVGPGAVRSKEALGNVNNTVGGSGFWNLIGLAAFLAGFSITVVATRDVKSNSRDRFFIRKRTLVEDDSLGKGKGDMTVSSGFASKRSPSKQAPKGKSVWPFGKSSKRGSADPTKSKSSASIYPSKVMKTTSGGKKLTEDTTVFTKGSRSMFTSGHTSYFHSNSGHESPGSFCPDSSAWQRPDEQSHYTGDYQSYYSGDDQSSYSREDASYHSQGSQQPCTRNYSRVGYSHPENWTKYSRKSPDDRSTFPGPSEHSSNTSDQPTFHNKTTHTARTPSVSDEESFYSSEVDSQVHR